MKKCATGRVHGSMVFFYSHSTILAYHTWAVHETLSAMPYKRICPNDKDIFFAYLTELPNIGQGFRVRVGLTSMLYPRCV